MSEPTLDLGLYRARIAALAEHGVYVGTSSWNYPGWLGQIYSESRYYAAQRAEGIALVRDARAFMAPLPLEVAGPTPVQAEILHGWGIATLDQLTSLAKAEIGRRLGTDGVHLWERAAGETTRVLHLSESAKTFLVEWHQRPRPRHSRRWIVVHREHDPVGFGSFRAGLALRNYLA